MNFFQAHTANLVRAGLHPAEPSDFRLLLWIRIPPCVWSSRAWFSLFVGALNLVAANVTGLNQREFLLELLERQIPHAMVQLAKAVVFAVRINVIVISELRIFNILLADTAHIACVFFQPRFLCDLREGAARHLTFLMT